MLIVNDNQTDVQTVSDFAHRYFKDERFAARGKEYVKDIIAYLESDMERFGYCAISKYSSILNEYTVLKRI